jgi:hypothetical protein
VSAVALLLFCPTLQLFGETLTGCSVGTYQPHYGGYNPIHTALVLTDPMGEQTAKFDLAMGGALVSLQYPQGTELLYGDVAGAMVQANWFGGLNTEMITESMFYNPQTGGDNALSPPTNIRGNPVHGAFCSDANTVSIVSGSTDYGIGRAGHRPLYAVYSTGPQRGAPNPFAAGCPDSRVNCAQFVAPYTITTIATFVQNSAGALPHYYLRLTQTASNVSMDENLAWSLELACYVAAGLTYGTGWPTSCVWPQQCVASNTPHLLAGLYPSSAQRSGVAFYISPSTYWNFNGLSTTFGSFDSTTPKASLVVNAGTGRTWPLSEGYTNRWVWFVLAGDWTPAYNFALAN